MHNSYFKPHQEITKMFQGHAPQIVQMLCGKNYIETIDHALWMQFASIQNSYVLMP